MKTSCAVQVCKYKNIPPIQFDSFARNLQDRIDALTDSTNEQVCAGGGSESGGHLGLGIRKTVF